MPNKALSLFSWNVNGIRAVIKKQEFQKFVEKYKPDIICLQETKASRDQVLKELIKSEPSAKDGYDEVSDKIAALFGFKHSFWNSAEKKGYSGTAIFTKIKPLNVTNNFPPDIIEKFNLTDDKYGNPVNEGRLITAEFDNFYIVTVYTPNSKGDLTRLKLRHKHWDPAFLEYLKQLQVKKPVLACGDLNVAHQEIDLANPKPNDGKHGFTREERQGFDKFLEAGLVDTFRLSYPNKTGAYSWWTHWANARARNVGWRIDYWLASTKITNRVKNPQIHQEQMGSDHCPVSIELK